MGAENETVKTVDAACQADRQWPRHLRIAHYRYKLAQAMSGKAAVAECLYEEYIGDGESLTLELLGAEHRLSPEHGERLYQRRFEGHIDTWLGTYSAGRGRDALRLRYRVEDVTEASVGAD